MKVKLVSAPAVESQTRGIGVYERELRSALEKISGVEIVNDHPDLTHFLYFDPFFLTLPVFRLTKTIVTVFDLTPIVLSRLYSRGIRGEIKWQIQRKLLQTVEAVITISKSAKKDIIDIIGVPDRKVTVTYLAAGENIRRLNVKKEDFVLYIGDINPNKNISTLLAAMAILKDRKLVLVGKALAQAKVGVGERVELRGFVSEEEKVKLLNEAGVYCQPSIYEGFGLPILEAMAAGTPVVCGRNSSLPEIAGEAAVYADVTSPADLAAKIDSVLKMSKTEREKIIDKGLRQVAKFSWTKTAQETIKVYEKVLAGL